MGVAQGDVRAVAARGEGEGAAARRDTGGVVRFEEVNVF